jgi:hypothetical protein
MNKVFEGNEYILGERKGCHGKTQVHRIHSIKWECDFERMGKDMKERGHGLLQGIIIAAFV